MRIGLNLLHALPEIGGGWNYIQNLLASIVLHDRHNQYVAFANTESASLLPASPDIETVVIPLRARSRWQRILCENTRLPMLARRFGVDCIHWFANTTGLLNAAPAVVTVYDLQPFQDITPFSWAKRTYLRRMMVSTAGRAAVLLPMSEATRDAMHERLGVAYSRMEVIPAVIEDGFAPAAAQDTERFRQRLQLPLHFWLYVAHYYPHKNHIRLFQAIRQLKNEGAETWPLVLRGDGLENSQEIRSALARENLQPDVTFLPRLARNELPLLYSAASGLVFPSLYEGGGMPVMEALACGCPATVSDIAATREFAADAATFFEPQDTRAIATSIRKLQTDSRLRHECRQRGLARAAHFRAPHVVDRLVRAYQRAA